MSVFENGEGRWLRCRHWIRSSHQPPPRLIDFHRSSWCIRHSERTREKTVGWDVPTKWEWESANPRKKPSLINSCSITIIVMVNVSWWWYFTSKKTYKVHNIRTMGNFSFLMWKKRACTHIYLFIYFNNLIKMFWKYEFSKPCDYNIGLLQSNRSSVPEGRKRKGWNIIPLSPPSLKSWSIKKKKRRELSLWLRKIKGSEKGWWVGSCCLQPVPQFKRPNPPKLACVEESQALLWDQSIRTAGNFWGIA